MKYALLVARQRSGTGALGSVLDKHPGVKYLGEIFHPDNLGQSQNFFTFYKDRVEEDPADSLPDARSRIFLEYLEDEAVRHPGKVLVVDVKYRSLHHLDGGWRGLVQPPAILEQARRRDAPVIHLTRRNSVATFVSGRLAEANKVWHARGQSEIKSHSTVVDIRQMSNYIMTTEREIALIEEWTGRRAATVKFDYDEMFDEAGQILPEIVGRIAAILGIGEFEDRSPSFVKQAPARLADAVENFDLVRRALSGTDNEWMLK